MLWAFMAAFMLASPAMAQPPAEDTKADAKEDTKADAPAAAEGETKEEAKAEEKADEKAEGDDAKAEDAPAEIKTDEEAVEAAGELINAIQQKHWGLAVGLGLTLLVFGLRKVKVLAKVPAKALPWVTAVLGVLGYVAAALMVDGADLMDAAMGGLMTGAAAVGLWEMVLKNFLGGKKAES
jgi:hypothetical protein